MGDNSAIYIRSLLLKGFGAFESLRRVNCLQKVKQTIAYFESFDKDISQIFLDYGQKVPSAEK